MCKRLICLICCILVMGLTTNVSADLLVHYQFDVDSDSVIVDASGNGFHGDAGITPLWKTGIGGNAMEFTGTDSVRLPADLMGLTSFIGSVAFWIKADVPTDIYTIWWGGDNNTGGGFGPENEMHMHLEKAEPDIWLGGECCFYLRADPNPNVHLHSDPEKSGADDPGAKPVNPILLGDTLWHHVAGTWDGPNNLANWYIDGALIMDSPYTSTNYNLSHMCLGQMANASRTFIGLLDEVYIYSNVLTPLEVYDLYDNPIPADINDNPVAKPQKFVLNQNYPNPFNPVTNIEFTLEKAGHTTLEIYNTLGQLVTTLIDGQMSSGPHQISFNAEKYTSGIYFYKLTSGNFTEMKKMMFLK